MTALARLFAGLAVGLLALLVGTGVAAACSCAEATLSEHMADADVVARVVVEKVKIPEEGASSEQEASYTMRPTYVWKGDVVSQFKVNSAVTGAECGLEGIVEGDDIVVFAQQSEEGFTANVCGGATRATDAFVAQMLDEVGTGVAVDADVEDKPGEWVIPAVAGAVALAVVAGLVLWWWVLPRKRR